MQANQTIRNTASGHYDPFEHMTFRIALVGLVTAASIAFADHILVPVKVCSLLRRTLKCPLQTLAKSGAMMDHTDNRLYTCVAFLTGQ